MDENKVNLEGGKCPIVMLFEQLKAGVNIIRKQAAKVKIVKP